jgi:hypothetical protein
VIRLSGRYKKVKKSKAKQSKAKQIKAKSHFLTINFKRKKQNKIAH